MDQSYLLKLKVDNFRNLSNQIIEFSKGINCIFGDNGNGKTNILEAVYFLLKKKSFRKKTSFSQILSIDCEKPEILFSSLVDKENNELSYTGKISEEGQTWYENNKSLKTRNYLPIVFISPFESYSFHNQSTFRRNWINGHFNSLSKMHNEFHKKYTKALKQRNALLSAYPPASDSQFIAIDKNLSEYAKSLLDERKIILSDLSRLISPTFEKIFSEKHFLELTMDSKFLNMSSDEIFTAFSQSLQKDRLNGRTNVGIHLDDYVFLFDHFNSYEFCSLGQQKMSYLSLLFAYIELFRYKFKTYPLVLLDDVSGELDETRWVRLIKFLREKEFQILITTANEHFKSELEKSEGVKSIYISNGEIS